MEELQAQLRAAQSELEPQFRALRAAIGALGSAERLAGEGKADALPMQKVLAKLETAAAGIENVALREAASSFAAATQSALDNLAYEFAADLREELAALNVDVTGRPPTLGIGLLALNIDMAARKGQWFYGKEPLTRLLPLSLKTILKAYEQQAKRISGREIEPAVLLQELHRAWQECLEKRDRNPAGKRINIVETFAQLIINRQSQRFWNSPARSTFRDYERALFVRDLVMLQDKGVTELAFRGAQYRMRLGVATKSQAGQASRSIWLPVSALDGNYYSDITFVEAE